MRSVDKAFEKTPRSDFLRDEQKSKAYMDIPLSIGFGQTNSQPSTVKMMLEWLAPQPGDKVLDVGSGSGWTTALLSYLVGASGEVYAVEKIPELLSFGRDNCRKAGVANAVFYPAGKKYGLAKFAPYDRILVSAAAKKLPSILLSQLKIGGKMVIPVGNVMFIITKTGRHNYSTITKCGFMFVPLVKS